MDASASSRVHADINKVCGYFLETEESIFPVSRHKNTVIKYTKLPDFDFDSKVSWPQSDSYVLHPRLRRIVALEDQEMYTSHSLRNEMPLKSMSSAVSSRKMVTIADDDVDRHESKNNPKFSKCQPIKKPPPIMLNKASESDKMPSKQLSLRSAKNQRDLKETKTCRASHNKVKPENPNISGSILKTERENVKLKNIVDNDQQRRYRAPKLPQTSIVRKIEVATSSVNKNVDHQARRVISHSPERKNTSNSLHKQRPKSTPITTSSRTKTPTKEINSKAKTPLYIRVPLDTNVANQVKCKGTDIDVDLLEISHKPNDQIKDSPATVEHRNVETIVGNLLVNNVSDVCIQTNPELEKVCRMTDICIELDTKLEKVGSVTDVSVETSRQSFAQPETRSTDMCVETYPEPKKVDEMSHTCMDITLKTTLSKSDRNTPSPTIFYDSLDIPNITLMQGIASEDPKENFNSKSLPNLNPPILGIISSNPENSYLDENKNCKSASFIIGRATVTYTTRQKIDFHVVGQKSELLPRLSSPLAYPLNVVSVFRKEISKHKDICDGLNVDNTRKKKYESTDQPSHNHPSGVESSTSSYSLNSAKLVKPSDVIGTIRLDDRLMHKDFICEQFQRELNFIDSFFESLQYLENCSLSGKGFTASKVENWVRDSGFNVKDPDYDCFIPKLEYGANTDDSETIAAKSLCLLNLLIRDEQRRAKNLLFVLKMREDALKDFTKSQILWLENKKKQENTDISTLKKKQRGALLKLQHECGEMQRMRKALLTLSEKRRLALLKTKKNIELKLNSNVNDILLAKKKIKRNSVDRNTAPLKCFDLSSSCEESVVVRVAVSEPTLPVRAAAAAGACVADVALSLEKSIQTGDSLLEQVSTRNADIAAENFIGVDGGYLNILFGNLALPQIFSSGKQYEVNEEALKNIVKSTNNSTQFGDNELEQFIEGIKVKDLDNSSTPSTARSLIDEFDEYYKGMVEEEKLHEHRDEDEDAQRTDEGPKDQYNFGGCHSDTSSTLSTVNVPIVELASPASIGSKSVEMQVLRGVDAEAACVQAGPLPGPPGAVDDACMQAGPLPGPTGAVDDTCMLAGPLPGPPGAAADVCMLAGPLPVPAGAAEPEPAPVSPPDTQQDNTPVTAESSNGSVSSASSLTSTLSGPMTPSGPSVSQSSLSTAPAHVEAEELRRQQLAIEREIKVLEQQQSQLLAVREIPDKPPPPYTPPVDIRAPSLPPRFSDESLEDKVLYHMLDPSAESTDAFDAFVKDFCLEMVEKSQADQSDKPWDACNLLPHKVQVDVEKLLKKTITEIKEVISVNTSPIAGMSASSIANTGARRCDHVDEILFAEWRRLEPGWTALHGAEAEVKSQLFETIFQQLLSETVDQYKLAVLAGNKGTESDGDTSLSQP